MLTRQLSPFLLPLIVLVLLIAAGLRFHALGDQSLWNDEGSAYVQATRTFSEIAENAGRDIHPPGYYWSLAAWRSLTGETEYALRSLSALASLLTVALTYALGRRLYSGVAGLMAAVFVALNSFNIYYAQEARMYALLALWATAAMWAFAGLVRAGGWRWALALALFNTAGLWTQYFYPSVMLAQGMLLVVWIASRWRNPDWRLLGLFVAANLLTILLYLPWITTAWGQISTWPSTGTPVLIPEALTTFAIWLIFGLTFEGNPLMVAALFFLLFGLLSFPRQDGPRTWWRLMLPPVWVGVSLLMFLALELFRPANLKFLLPAQIGVALWMGRGVWVLWTLRTRRDDALGQIMPKLAAAVGTLAVIVTLWNGVAPLYNDAQYQRDDYRSIAALIEADPNTSKAVILNAPGQSEVFGYYYGDSDDVYPLPIGLNVDHEATAAQLEAIINDYDRIYALMWGTDERDPEGIVKRKLDRETFQIDEDWYGSVRLARYVTPLEPGILVESGARFGPANIDDPPIELVSYALSDDTLQNGDVLQLRLDWRTDTPLDARYKVFVQLLHPDGTLAIQRDSEPLGGTRPTATWEPGETLADRHALPIPDDLHASHYRLIIGLYNPDNANKRLIVNRDADHLTLGNITVHLREEE